MPYLGRLKYRTSYGQNVLGHLVETAHIAGVMAAELGIEPTLVKRCGVPARHRQGAHPRGRGQPRDRRRRAAAQVRRGRGVAHAVEAHHNEVAAAAPIEAVLTQASDTCSAARPGARRESLETYVKRLARIEEIARRARASRRSSPCRPAARCGSWCSRARSTTSPRQVIAREIAKQIEDELTYPGQIRVTVVRESRATEIAH